MPRFATGGDETRRRSVVRLYVLSAMFALGFGLLVSRAILFHVKDNARLERIAMRQYRTAVQESTRRGKILDVQGRDLAVNVEAPSVWIDPRSVTDAAATAKILSELLDVDEVKLAARLNTNRKFEWVKRWVTEEQADKVEEAAIEGVHIMMENKRSYPNGTLAATVLGAVGLDSEALGGLELALNEHLVQRYVPNSYKRDARGHLYLSPTDTVAMNPLSSVELTIDKTIQFIAEQVLRVAVESSQARGGMIVVVDPRSGDILAMANEPTFDPNHYESYDLKRWKNSAITDPYEPGSTFKVMIVASALDAGTVTPEEIFFCENGAIRVGDHVLHDAHPHGELNVHDIVKVSSNIGAYKVEKTMGPERIYDAIRAFGFGEQSGIELPGESAGILASASRWSEVQFATIAFGQGVSATPLQMTMAFAAVANGGWLLKPHVVKRIRDENGNIIRESSREVRRRSISLATAQKMRLMLEAVVGQGGTGRAAASLEYGIAGKTGTAQKSGPHGGYMKGNYFASFVGFAPSDDPRLVVFVGIDEPKGRYYGGQVAAPAFREVVEKTLHYLKVPARGGIVTAEASEKGTYVQPELPAAPVEMPRFIARGENVWELPDFTGLTMRGVMKAAHDVPLNFRLAGTGVAVRQYPAPGNVVRAGDECVVEFRSML